MEEKEKEVTEEVEPKQIKINKYVYFDCEDGHFCLTPEALELIYRQKSLICSYSGANEWCNHFTCEMIDFCSGASIYNYSLGTTQHEKEIPKVLQTNRPVLLEWIQKSTETPWGKKCYELLERIITEAEAD